MSPPSSIAAILSLIPRETDTHTHKHTERERERPERCDKSPSPSSIAAILSLIPRLSLRTHMQQYEDTHIVVFSM
jgi:hypothetical protein